MNENQTNDHHVTDNLPSSTPNYQDARRGVQKDRRHLPLGVLAQLKPTKNIAKRKAKREDTFITQKHENSFKPLKAATAECREKYMWGGVILATICSAFLTVAGLIMLSYRERVQGWIIIGTGIILISIIVTVVVVHYRFQFEEHRKKIEKASMESKQKFYHKSLCDFPPDPVLRRGIITLVRHGQEDCEECRRMREEEEQSDTYKDFSDETEHPLVPSRKDSLSTRSKRNSLTSRNYSNKVSNRSSTLPRSYDSRKNSRVRNDSMSPGNEEQSSEKDGIPLHIAERYRAFARKKRPSFSMASTVVPSLLNNGNCNNNVNVACDSSNLPLYQTKAVCYLSRYEAQCSVQSSSSPRLTRKKWRFSRRQSLISDSLILKTKESS